MRDSSSDDGEQLSRFQRKEIHNHYSNGTQKLVWAWATFTTFLVVATFGFLAKAQWDTNESLRDAVINLGERVGRLELQIDQLQRTIERGQE